MDDVSKLERKIGERLAAAKKRRLADQAAVRRSMEECEKQTARFAAIAQRLMGDFLRPRMHKLASLFPNSHLSDVDRSVGYGAVCEFDHTPEYPASTKLDIGISADSTNESMILTYDLQILPIYFKFDGHNQLAVPLNAVDEGAIATWIDSRLLDFTDTYLKLQSIDQYQQENMVVDPVCRMRINRTNAAASVEHNGQMYYFCIDECRQTFLADPGRYAQHW